jgi:hypothetical protein
LGVLPRVRANGGSLRSKCDCRAGRQGHNNTARGSDTKALTAPLGREI